MQTSNGDGGNVEEGSAAVDGAPSDASSAPEAAQEDAASGSDASMQPDSGAPPPDAGPAETGPTTDAGTSDAPTGGGVNLVTNGDFSQGDMYWLVLLNLDANVANVTVANGALCVMTASSSVTVGYPTDLSKAFSIVAGTTYTLSYTAWSSPTTTMIGAKIGQVQTPFTADITASDSLGLTPQTFSHTFTAARADPVAGVVFIMNPLAGTTTDQVCFANVSVTAM